MKPIFEYIRQVGMNDAFSLWRLSLMGRCFSGDATAPITLPQATLRTIVGEEKRARESGSYANLTCIWIIIDGRAAAVQKCAQWVRKQCPDDEEFLFDFVTTNTENGGFLDGSLSLVVPAAWEPTGVSGFVANLVSKFPRLRFIGSALEFHGVELQPHSGSSFLGRNGELHVHRVRLTNPATAEAA